MLEIIEAKYVDDYCVYVVFNDGRKGVVDLKEALWGTVFEPLRDKKLFSQLSVSSILHTVTWPNDADLAPEYVHQKLIEQTQATER